MSTIIDRLNRLGDEILNTLGTYSYNPELTDLGNEEAEEKHYQKVIRDSIGLTLKALEEDGYLEAAAGQTHLSDDYFKHVSS